MAKGAVEGKVVPPARHFLDREQIERSLKTRPHLRPEPLDLRPEPPHLRPEPEGVRVL